MPTYRCKIALKEGQTIERIVQSGSMSLLKKEISSAGEFLVKAEKIRDLSNRTPFFGRFSLNEKVFYSFNHEFLTLLKAGIPVVIALDGIIEKQEDQFFVKILTDIRGAISDGESIPNAFEKFEHIFSPIYVSSLRSGEASGDIPAAIEEYLVYFERSRQLKQKVVTASVYPAILTVCSIFVTAFLIVFVVPAITGTFVEAGAELPFFTEILLKFSDYIRSNVFYILIAGIMVILGLRYYMKTNTGKQLIDMYYLKVPFLGNLSVIYSTALFSSSLSTVLSSGLPINHALPISMGLIKNSRLQLGIKKAVHSIEKGGGFAQSLGRENIFPDMAIRMFAAGEESGNLEKVLKDVAKFYEKEVETKLSVVASTIEPALMVLMGLIIGFILLAMYMPIFQMAGTIG